MKPKQALFLAGVAFQVAILSVTLYFLHEVREKGETSFELGRDEEVEESDITLDNGVKLPFAHYVTGIGKVACSNYVKVNTRREGIVDQLFVKEGDVVHAGDALFQVDDGVLRFVFHEKVAEYETALAELKFFEGSVTEPHLKSDVLKSIAKEKEACMRASEKVLFDCKVVAPLEGRVLKVNVNPGEYTRPGEEALVIGSENPLYLHVLIDEKEMWRVSPTKNLRAIALHKTNPNIHFVLNFVSIKPVTEPSFKNEGKLEVVFAFDKGKAPIYLDQTLDVYIEAASPQDTSYLDYQFNQTFDK